MSQDKESKLKSSQDDSTSSESSFYSTNSVDNAVTKGIDRPPTPVPSTKTTQKQPTTKKDDLKKSTVHSEIADTKGSVSLNIIQKIIKCLKRDKDDEIALLKSVLNMVESCNEKKESMKKIMCLLLTCIENSTLEDIEIISSKLQDIILPEKLRCFVIDSKDIKDFTPFTITGEFSVIFKGLWEKDGKKTKVFIKRPLWTDFTHLKHEANMMTELQHPNIIKILGITKPQFGIVKEFIPKGPLDRCLKERFYTSEEILKAILDIASGMEYLAAKQIIHVDLFIQSIWVDAKGICKIVNFDKSCYAKNSENHYEYLKNTFKITETKQDGR